MYNPIDSVDAVSELTRIMGELPIPNQIIPSNSNCYIGEWPILGKEKDRTSRGQEYLQEDPNEQNYSPEGLLTSEDNHICYPRRS